jgi:hypothetical protein
LRNSALIAVLILERPMCLDCISAKSGLPVAEVDHYLTVISRAMRLRAAEDRCRVCREHRKVFSAARPMD